MERLLRLQREKAQLFERLEEIEREEAEILAGSADIPLLLEGLKRDS